MPGTRWNTGYWRDPKPLNILLEPHAILDSSKKVMAIRKFPPNERGHGTNVVRIPDDIPVTIGWTWTGRMFVPPSEDIP